MKVEGKKHTEGRREEGKARKMTERRREKTGGKKEQVMEGRFKEAR